MSLRRKVSLRDYCTMQVGGLANYFAEPENESSLSEVLQFAAEKKLPLFCLGKGSNVLFSDEGFSGIVILLTKLNQDKLIIDKEKFRLTASGGIYLSRLVTIARDEGLGGAEFLCNVPGTLGGAIAMNAGFSRDPKKKFEIGQLVERVRVMTLDGEVRELSKSDLEFSYRMSNLKKCIVLEGTLQLCSKKSNEIAEEVRLNFEYRNERQDLGHPSSGSIFKNPSSSNLAAAALIEKAGLKGKRVGDAMISDRHANYIVNLGSAKTADITQLISETQQVIREKTGTELETEVRIIQNA